MRWGATAGAGWPALRHLWLVRRRHDKLQQHPRGSILSPSTPKASTDRLDLTRATRANLSPVWGLSLAAGLTALLADPASRSAR